MGYIYMMNQRCSGWPKNSAALPEASGTVTEKIVLTCTETEPVFRTMKRIYNFLDSCKTTCANTAIVLLVDSKSSKIVNSYFRQMSDSDYENFTLADGEVLRYVV